MAENGVNGHQSNLLQWKVGFMNRKKKYLTAESFGFKVNTSGAALKKKQIWFLEQDPTDDSVYIRSCQGRYMMSDKYGKVSCDVEPEEKGPTEKYEVVYSADGRWALKQKSTQNYFKGLEEKAECFDKNPGEDNWWCMQLYAHPQIHLRNVNRKRYAHLQDDELICSELIPWGSDALVLLDFDEDGKYTLKSCDNRFLSCDGTLENEACDKTKFCIEVHSGAISFKDCNGRYLSAVGKGTMKSKNTKVTKDELFTIEDSHPQCQIISHNDKSVSVKQGQDVTANQPIEEIEDTEIFQMEHNRDYNAWAFRASNGKYWSLNEGAGTVEAKQAERTKHCFFKIEWQDDGYVGIKGFDDKYLSNRPTGIVYSTPGPNYEECNRFRIHIVNRPLLILKSEFGYVGTKPKENQYICNKTKYDILQVDYDIKGGFYTIKNKDGKNWYVGDDNMVYLDENNSTKFHFIFCGDSMLAIRAPNGRYLCGEQNGLFKATAEEILTTSKWEF